MEHQHNPKSYDVIIIGAGPAGSSCSLALRNAGLRVAIMDKHFFPRDKVCGDAIPGRAIKFLHEIDPTLKDALSSFSEKLPTKRTVCYFKNKELDFSWSLEAYTSTRMSFDNFLFSQVRQQPSFDVMEGVEVNDIIRTEQGYSVTIRNSDKHFNCTMLIGADGTNGLSAKKLTGIQMNRKHHVAAVRAYYTGLADMEDTCTEIYFDKKYLPGYFWIFPIQGGLANVGMGILSDDVVQKNLNVKKGFYDFIERSAVLRRKFRDAKPAGLLQGCGLPLGSRWVTMSGDHFLLTGDAACLIDPVSGDGIGNAVLSGKLAAEQVIRCFSAADFSAGYVKTYEQQLYKAVGAEMKKKAAVLKSFARMPFLFDIAFSLGKNKVVKQFMK
ncbi:MAG TPA: NAD(P)/FAD-dependent oxidoreductase [Chitinophaga sp.]